jgi:hypothetical protein
MSKFDKFCALLTIPVGVIFLVLGTVGLFLGAEAHFTLPPVLGALPFLLGWSMCVTLIKFWRGSGGGGSAGSEKVRVRVHSRLFDTFLNEHPEYREAPMKIQWNGFQLWLDAREKP